MVRVIEVKFISDKLITEGEKLPCIRYINRILSGLMEDIISNKGYVKVISKKGFAYITFTSANDILNKLVNSKLLDAPAFRL
jgi:hypothetical protein